MPHASESRRGERLRRQLRLIAELLRGETLTRRKIASLLGLKLAAADRHLKVLRELPGIRESRRGAIVFNRAALLHQPSFPAAIAACLSYSLAALFRGTDYERGMREALEYVISNTSRRSLFQDLQRKFVFVAKGGDSSLPEAGQLLDELIEAVLHSNRVRIRYKRFAGATSHLTLEPLSIVVYEHQLYVLATSRGHDVHPYRFSRIAEVDVQTSRFRYPSKAEYDPEQILANCLGIYLGAGPVEEVRIRLAPAWRTYAVTHRWHQTQKTELVPKGVLVTLSVRITPEVVAWVLGFGADAEVLAPSSLRAQIGRHANAMAKRYRARFA